MKKEGTGGSAIKNSISVDGETARFIANEIVMFLEKEMIDSSPLGSTGKKPKYMLSGDVDIAVKLEYNEDNVNKLKSFIEENYPRIEHEFANMPGLKILSWGYPIQKTDDFGDLKIDLVQVDFMFTNDIEYAKFMYHSPNFINGESQFKGLFRTNLMVICASHMPIDPNNEYYKTEYFEDGEIKSFWKYSLTYSEGLKLVHKTYEGKKKRLKNPTKIKDDTIDVTKNINDIIELVFGYEVTLKDLNSFESIVKYLFSDDYVYRSKERLDIIFEDFFNDVRHQDLGDLGIKLHKVVDEAYKSIQF